MTLAERDDFATLFLHDTPLIDTRAPVEFAKGAFPLSQNLPLLNDDERAQVGTRYKQQGRESAIALGEKLVSDNVKHTRIAAWQAFAKTHPDGALYCFRGGLRSKVSQQWLYAHTGIHYPRIKGGYKAMRTFLLNTIDTLSHQLTPVVLAGQTGCGKTQLLPQLPSPVDLEGLAGHRGSAFGSTLAGQPTPIAFENALAIQLLKLQNAPFISIENEGAHIGRLNVPLPLYHACQKAEMVLLHADLEERLQRTLKEYVIDMLYAYVMRDGPEQGFVAFTQYFQGGLDKIKNRLGGTRYQKLNQMTAYAFAQHQRSGDVEGYYPVLKRLLMEYYDPMYQYQLKKQQQRVVFQGNAEEVSAYLHAKATS